LETVRETKGWSKKPKPVRVHPMLLENADIITFTSGMRIDNAIFDVNQPREIDAKYRVNTYDIQYMNDSGDTQQFCGEIAVYRNNQRITGFVPEGYSLSSARGNGDSLARIIYHRASLEYKVFSKQNNQMDIIHGIQQNKNQNQNDFPKNYSRLVKYLKDWHYEQIRTYMNGLIRANDPAVSPASISPITVSPASPLSPVALPAPPVPVVAPRVPVVAPVAPPVPVVAPPVISLPSVVEVVAQAENIEEPHKTDIQEEPVKQVEELAHEDLVEETSIGSRAPLPIIVAAPDEVEESRNYLRLAAKQIMDIAADPAYRGVNGYEIYQMVQQLLLR
jgi:hypothetical protein